MRSMNELEAKRLVIDMTQAGSKARAHPNFYSDDLIDKVNKLYVFVVFDG